jgi:hypothetical protein
MNDEWSEPRQYLGVMISSTFADLKQHRAALMKAIEAQGLHAVAMEQDAALPDGTVIDSSLRKVRDAAAYIGVISHKYGQIPDPGAGNPDGYSLTELEFREARRLGRPILIFIMGEDHDVKLADVERDPAKAAKLDAFRAGAKQVTAGSSVQRVYKEFSSLGEFEVAAAQSVAELRRFLDRPLEPAHAVRPDDTDGIPRPPDLYAEPRYIGSHAFVGRAAELEMLSTWAAPAEKHPVLLFEAIGGTGKSMLTWEWTVGHASAARTGWAGTFWYSFYEKGAVMADFCRRALAYMTGQPLKAFRKKRQPELTELLLRQLQARPWLVVLDGLERVLVSYHRLDAAQLADEQAGHTDEIAHRDPAAATRPEDDELLRALAAAAPSKILITSRLVPRVLLNRAGQPIPGVRHEHLSGLRPADAEAMLRTCGVRGGSEVIQAYLRRHCDCHPLVTGVVAGLVNDYLPDRGNFDRWAADPGHGGRLNLAELDLVQKRNHILEAALTALPDTSRQLLSTLALLSEAVDYDLLMAVNPHLPSEHQEPPAPERPQEDLEWLLLDEAGQREREREREREFLAECEEYEQSRRAWLDSQAYTGAARELARTVRDLERRGLLQYDRPANHYDLHPVVRGYAAGLLGAEDRSSLGQRAVDYFSQQARDPYETAQTLDDVRNGLRLIQALLQAGRMQEAFDAYVGDLSQSLFFNLEAYEEMLSLLRPFFTRDWTSLSVSLSDHAFSRLINDVACALNEVGQLDQSLALRKVSLRYALKNKTEADMRADIVQMAYIFQRKGQLAAYSKYIKFSLELAELLDDNAELFRARLDRFDQLGIIGQWSEAEAAWGALDPMGRSWPRPLYRPGEAEEAYAQFQFWRGKLTENFLSEAERLAAAGQNRPTVRYLHALRGQWQLTRENWTSAAESLHEAIRMTRETGGRGADLEAGLALARLRLGQRPAARDEAARLSEGPHPPDLELAELWHALGDTERAAVHALAAYQEAWSDGQPYVYAYDLSCATRMLGRLGIDIPRLPAYDPARAQPLPFEDQIRAVIEKTRSRRDAL